MGKQCIPLSAIDVRSHGSKRKCFSYHINYLCGTEAIVPIPVIPEIPVLFLNLKTYKTENPAISINELTRGRCPIPAYLTENPAIRGATILAKA